MMDLILRNAHAFGLDGGEPVAIGIAEGKIAAIAPTLEADAPVLDLGGRLVAPGLVETHIHLDKTCIIDRCKSEQGTVAEAVAETAAAKAAFTQPDIYARATRTLEKCLLNGTMLMRTHVEVDPGIGLTGFEAVSQLARDYAWAIDIEICAFPQEGLLNNPGTDALLEDCLRRGGAGAGRGAVHGQRSAWPDRSHLRARPRLRRRHRHASRSRRHAGRNADRLRL
jgi:cytosine/creatinine deaminase